LGRSTRSRVVLAAALASATVFGAAGAGAARGSAPTLAQLVGQRLIVAMTGTSADPDLLARVRAGQVGGVILSTASVRSPAQVRALTDSLRAAAGAGGQPAPLIAVDQEGGRTRRLAWAPPFQSADRLGGLTPAAVRAKGLATARALRAAGIDVDLAPVADVPSGPGSFIAARGRAFSSDPALAAALTTAFAQGLAAGGVAATAKHFPGLGRATRTTDLAVVTIPASRAKLETDLTPFRALIAAGVPLVMLSNATYTALGPKPAVLERGVHALLRDELGFQGVTISDALNADSVLRNRSVESTAVLAAEAGTDLLLFTSDETQTAAVYERLLERARDGTIPRTSLERSYGRILRLKQAHG
jgi:beta-N-acetylhexosaminidase